MFLTKSQRNAVKQLNNCYENLINKNNTSDKLVYFKAPTGSGKTFMSSEFISNILERNSSNGEKTIVIVATVSSGKLPEQFANKLFKYKKYHNFQKYDIEYIPSPSNSKSNKQEQTHEFILENNKVFVFGISSFGRSTIFYKQNILNNFLTEAKQLQYKIIYIRDEAHIGEETTKKADLENFDTIMEKNADFIIKMTATPKSLHNLVEITLEDLESDEQFLLKNKEWKDDNVHEVISEEDLIDKAIAIFKESKEKYQNLKDVVINPAMLIQVRNDSQTDREAHKQFVEGLALLEKKLKDADLKYLKYIDSTPTVHGTSCPNTLEYASQNNSIIDVIIFKIGPATGWDIPRANTLLQLRSVSSENLNIQTLGRIMRNPYPGLEKNDVTDIYYLFSSYQKPTRTSASYILKEKFKTLKLYKGEINRNSNEFIANNNEYIKRVKEYLHSNNFRNSLIDFSNQDFVYSVEKWNYKEIAHNIDNYLNLKIFNIRKTKEYETLLKVSCFEEEFRNIANKYNKDYEKVRYVFFKQINDIKKIYKDTIDWFEKNDNYILIPDGELLECYHIWKDNETNKTYNDIKQKLVSFEEIENYGYEQIVSTNNGKNREKDKYIQYLDSLPEMKFFNDIVKSIKSKTIDSKDIRFFAKMPTLGSKVSFEYFSTNSNTITKSYIDYALLVNDILTMVEVKSNDADYDENKTDDLGRAYFKYMLKQCNELKNGGLINNQNIKKINLVIYKYDKKLDKRFISCFDEKTQEWKEDLAFNDMINIVLNK